ncbi:MAG: transporter ATP-binding protein [Rhodoferax sp.]|nr:transporter ATP-binding protein [Rhodoferax sp.]
MSAPAYLLQGIDLTRRYGGFAALDNVTLQVRPGEIRGLIGSNGAGKSTLMDALSGRGITSGTVLLEGRDLAGLDARERRRAGMARSFQKTNIFPDLSVAEQVHLAARASETNNADEVMQQLSLAHLGARRAADISYGDQRRLDLALALTGKPKLLLLDEPAAGLTVEESMTLAELLRRLALRWGITVVIVEHDMDVIFSICSQLTVLHLGKILAEGTPAEVRAMPKVVEAYLGSSA